MSSISNTRSVSPLDLIAKTKPQPQKQLPKDKNPLSAVDTNPLSQADKPVINPDSPNASARIAAEGLVSTTFIEPILKQIRESNTAPPPFGPSSAEKQFSALLDTKLADEIVHAANFPLVDKITSQLLRNMPTVENAIEQSLDIKG